MIKPNLVKALLAYFLGRAGDKMDKLKLMKLLYLAERAYLLKYHSTLTGDRFVSMTYGPVLSDTLNLINSINDTESGEHWRQHFQLMDNGREVRLLADDAARLKFNGKLSAAVTDILQNVWSKFGQMQSAEIVNYTHQNCPEWQDPKGSAIPIEYEDILANEFKKQDAHDIAEHIRGLEKASNIFR